MPKQLSETAFSITNGSSSMPNHHIAHIKPTAAAKLLEYPRRELMYCTQEEDDMTRHFVGVIPESSSKKGRLLSINEEDGRGRTTVPINAAPIGLYEMELVPEYFGEMDWYELVPVE